MSMTESTINRTRQIEVVTDNEIIVFEKGNEPLALLQFHGTMSDRMEVEIDASTGEASFFIEFKKGHWQVFIINSEERAELGRILCDPKLEKSS